MSLLVRIMLLGRRDRKVVVGGLHWRYCLHRSHRSNLKCWRWADYDGLCVRHNRTCWGEHG